MFAVIAASVVLYGGLADAKKNKLLFRLVLHYIMIVTSVVVPLELPMELSLAVMIIIFMSILLPFADDNNINITSLFILASTIMLYYILSACFDYRSIDILSMLGDQFTNRLSSQSSVLHRA